MKLNVIILLTMKEKLKERIEFWLSNQKRNLFGAEPWNLRTQGMRK